MYTLSMMFGRIEPLSRYTGVPLSQPAAEYASLSDPELMGRVREADDRALTALYDRHVGLVYKLARAIVGGDADAEEVTSDVFLEVWERGDRFDPDRGAFRPWLATLASE